MIEKENIALVFLNELLLLIYGSTLLFLYRQFLRGLNKSEAN